VLSPDQVRATRAFFGEHGWVVLRGAMGSMEVVGQLAAEIEAVYARAPHAVAEVAPGVFQLAGVTRASAALEAAVFQSGWLGSIARACLGCEAVRLLQDLVLIKPAVAGGGERGVDGGAFTPGPGRIGWHHDYAYTRYLEAPRTASVRLALDRETAETGAMEVLDGSHRWGLDAMGTPRSAERSVRDGGDEHGDLDPREHDGFVNDRLLPALVARDPMLGARVEAARRVLVLEPGDVSVHHALTLHGSPPNNGGGRRRTLIHHVFDASLRFVEEGLPTPDMIYWIETDDEGRLAGPLHPRLP